MRTPSHFALLASVLVCLIFSVFFLMEPAPKPREETWAPTVLTIPSYPADPAELASTAQTLKDPFRPRFFETARFKGLARNPTGGYAAIFLMGGRNIIQLPVGQTLDGITLVEADGRKCRLLVGSATREFSLQKK